MATTQQLTTWLAEAEAAYHQISTGGAIRTLVDQSGERIEYQRSNLSTLRAYIAELKSQLGVSDPPRGPLGFYF